MTAAALLTELHNRGIQVEPCPDGKLRLVPKSRLTPDLIEAVRQHKAELRHYFRTREIARWCELHHIDISVGAAILEIEDQALTLGWSWDRLWNPRFWPHSGEQPRGLASMLQPGDTITDVTQDNVVIFAQGRHLLRFPRTDA
jgi:hypothetical protein